MNDTDKQDNREIEACKHTYYLFEDGSCRNNSYLCLKEKEGEILFDLFEFDDMSTPLVPSLTIKGCVCLSVSLSHHFIIKYP